MRTIRLPSGEVIEERRSSGNGGKLIWWMMVTFFGLVILGTSAYGSYINRKLEYYDGIVETRGQRLAVLETNVIFVREQLAQINLYLKELTVKVDALANKR